MFITAVNDSRWGSLALIRVEAFSVKLFRTDRSHLIVERVTSDRVSTA
jgi:hypothetical protein